MSRLVARAPIASFLLTAFAISWALWTPLVVSRSLSGAGAWAIYYAGVVGPAAAAFLCATLGASVTPAALRRRFLQWRPGARWYAIAILLPFAVRAVAVIAVTLSGTGPMQIVLRPAAEIGRITLLMILLVPFEEAGWRGYCLPLLQQRWTPLASSMIVGAIWALWHLPLAWASVGHQQSSEPLRYMAWFAGTIIPVSCVATWLFNRTGESLAVVSLFHVAVNLADFLLVLPARIGEQVLLATSILTAVFAALVWRSGDASRSTSEASRGDVM